MAPRLGLGNSVTADPASGLFASTPLLLDTYPNAHRAYSVRKLRTEYTGYAMKIRVDIGDDGASTTDKTADVAFDDDGFVSASSKIYNPSAGGSDGDTLATFVGSEDEVYCHTWYDQSGSPVVNATDTGAATLANQPKLYTSNSLVTDVTGSGTPRAALLYDSSDKLNITNTGLALNAISVFTSFNITNSANSAPFTLNYQFGSPTRYFFPYLLSNVLYFYHDNQAATSQNLDEDGYGLTIKRRLFSFLCGTGSQKMVINGNTNTAGSPSTATDSLGGSQTYVSIGHNLLIAGLTGKMQEFIVYDSDQTSNNAGITSEINTALEVY